MNRNTQIKKQCRKSAKDLQRVLNELQDCKPPIDIPKLLYDRHFQELTSNYASAQLKIDEAKCELKYAALVIEKLIQKDGK